MAGAGLAPACEGLAAQLGELGDEVRSRHEKVVKEQLNRLADGNMAVPVGLVIGVAPVAAGKVVTPAPHPRGSLPADVDVVGRARGDIDNPRSFAVGHG